MFGWFSSARYTLLGAKKNHHLRSQFEADKTQTLKDLRLGEDIYCIVYGAQPGSFHKAGNESVFKFRKIGGIILDDGNRGIFSYVITEKGLFGEAAFDHTGPYHDSINFILTVRVAESGDLIGEWAVSRALINERREAIPLVNSSYYAGAYLLSSSRKKLNIFF